MNFHILDTETASLQGPPVEIAWLLVDEHLNIQSEFVSLVDPERPIDPHAQEVHGISDADVAGKPKMPEIANCLDEQPIQIIGHNIKFDIRMVSPHIKTDGSMCTLELAREYIKGTTNHKLETLQQELQLPVQSSHSALGDVHTCRDLLLHIIQLTGLDFMTLWNRAQQPKMLTKMPFGKHKGRSFHLVPRDYREWLLTTDIDRNLRYTLEQMRNV